MIQSNFQILTFNPCFIALVDLNLGGRSVTNDAESIIKWLSDRGMTQDHRVFYRDSEGDWDEMKHFDGEFIGFSPIEQSMKLSLINLMNHK